MELNPKENRKQAHVVEADEDIKSSLLLRACTIKDVAGQQFFHPFTATAHSEAVLKAGGSKCLRMPNMASQNPENSVGETRCWTILIYPYLILFISSMFLHKLFWALFSNKRSTRTSTPVSSLPKATFRLSCAKCYVSKGESPRERTDVLKETYEQTALWSCLILQNLQIPEGNCLI